MEIQDCIKYGVTVSYYDYTEGTIKVNTEDRKKSLPVVFLSCPQCRAVLHILPNVMKRLGNIEDQMLGG